MSKEASSLQFDLFSGELVDNRTRTQKRRDKQRDQPQQIGLFPQQELAQFGLNAHPQMAHEVRTPLELNLQDVRTVEEKERDLQRAAEAATFSLFVDDASPATPSATADLDETQDLDEPVDLTSETTDKLTAYLALVKAAEERASTTWIDPQYSGAFLAQVGLAMSVAQQSDLLEDEITTALTIGEYRGSHQTIRHYD